MYFLHAKRIFQSQKIGPQDHPKVRKTPTWAGKDSKLKLRCWLAQHRRANVFLRESGFPVDKKNGSLQVDFCEFMGSSNWVLRKFQSFWCFFYLEKMQKKKNAASSTWIGSCRNDHAWSWFTSFSKKNTSSPIKTIQSGNRDRSSFFSRQKRHLLSQPMVQPVGKNTKRLVISTLEQKTKKNMFHHLPNQKVKTKIGWNHHQDPTVLFWEISC